MDKKNESIGEVVKRLRTSLGLSQEQLAKSLGIQRSAVSQIESVGRMVSSEELKKLCTTLNVTADYLLGLEKGPEVVLERSTRTGGLQGESVRISVPKAKVAKFKEVLLYILERCAGKPNVGETVLYKLLYFADFNFYEMYEEFLTGATYRKLQFGPAPRELAAIADEMVKNNELQILSGEFGGKKQKRYLPLRKANLQLLRAHEKEMLDRVIEQLSDRNATWLSTYSHEDIPWKATADKADIDYELVFYRTAPYSVRDYEDDEDENEEA